MAEQIKPAVAYIEQLRGERATSNSRAGLLPEARQINIPPRRLRTKTLEDNLTIFKLVGANADVVPRGRLLHLDGAQRTNLPPAFDETLAVPTATDVLKDAVAEKLPAVPSAMTVPPPTSYVRRANDRRPTSSVS